MRHGLLLTAVATVTVPSLFAVLGVVNHDHTTKAEVVLQAGTATAGTATAGTTMAGTARPGPFPVVSSTARSRARSELAARQRAASGPVTIFTWVTASQRAVGLRLLSQAADAGRSASYAGTERISQSGVDGTVLLTSQVWHQAGGGTVVRTSEGTSSPAPATAVASSSPEGVFGVTKALVALLGRHYIAAYAGGGTAAGRPAAVVAVYRLSGTLAARYWLDRGTMLPLRRELFGSSGQVLGEDLFTQVSLDPPTAPPPAAPAAAVPAGAAPTGAAPAKAAPAKAAPAASAWVTAASPTGFRASLAGQGWPLPPVVSGGLPLYTAASDRTGDGQAVDLEYSDGLYVVSMFVQRGNLAASLPGWQPLRMAGQQAYVSGHTVAWSRGGFVYTVIADAPPATVSQVIAAVPGSSSGPDGILDRLGRGLARLARLANPFG